MLPWEYAGARGVSVYGNAARTVRGARCPISGDYRTSGPGSDTGVQDPRRARRGNVSVGGTPTPFNSSFCRRKRHPPPEGRARRRGAPRKGTRGHTAPRDKTSCASSRPRYTPRHQPRGGLFMRVPSIVLATKVAACIEAGPLLPCSHANMNSSTDPPGGTGGAAAAPASHRLGDFQRVPWAQGARFRHGTARR